MEKTALHDVLDAYVAGKIDIPTHASILRIPLIDHWEEGRVCCTFSADPDLKQPQGVIFGGYLSAVADELMGLAALTVLEKNSVFATSDFRIQFFRPAHAGNIIFEANVLNKSRSSIHVESVFKNAKGKLIAKASAVQSVRKLEAQTSLERN